MDRYLYSRLVRASECYYKMSGALVYLSGDGPEGYKVMGIADVVYVTRQMSVYADIDEPDDDIRYLKFEVLMKAPDYDTEEKTRILLGETKDPLKRVRIKNISCNSTLNAYESFKEALKNKKAKWS